MQSKNIVTINGLDLPECLQRLHKPPKQLHTLGDAELLRHGLRVGIVGARKFTPYGREVTIKVTTALAREGATIVSGLALGIDSLAHRACLEVNGKTIAVLPSGLENIYPASHRGLAAQIVESGGLLVTEQDHRFRPFIYSFVQRNRIVAALSDVLIIPEAAKSSGSLNTASHALELGVTVIVAPGNITSPYSEGTNRLIANGATPLISIDDLLDQLELKGKNKLEYLPENEIEAAIVTHLKKGSDSVDNLLAAAKLEAQIAQMHLTMLEIKGVVEVSGGRWSLK